LPVSLCETTGRWPSDGNDQNLLVFQKHNTRLKREFSPPVGSLIDFMTLQAISGL
jgi:hypothetical protein